jgi:hypothetical protein
VSGEGESEITMNDLPPCPEPPLRPRDFAVLLLSWENLTPRQRARDQQADRAGLELKRRVLSTLVALDPEPEDLESALMAIVERVESPSGPVRAMALALLEDWRAASATPEWLAHLIGEAVRQPKKGTRGDRQHPE